MQSIEKRIEVLEAKQPANGGAVMFIHFVGLCRSGDADWVRRYTCGLQRFDRGRAETLQDFQRRVEVSAARPSATGLLIATAFESPSEPMAK